MNSGEQHAPGAAFGAEVRKEGERWTLVLVRELAHPPAKVMPPPWLTYSPLLPLALLLFTGLYMVVLPYAAKWRSGREA